MRPDDHLDDELASHIELLTERYVAQGMSLEEARYAARRQFGGVTQLKESLADQRAWPFLSALRIHLAYALRQMRTAPRFTLSAAAILAVGIGAATSIFSVVNAVLLRPLPYVAPDRLVWVGEVLKRNTTDEVTLTPNFLDWRSRNQVFSAMAAFHGRSRTLLERDGALPLRTLKTSAALLPVLDTRLLLGRAFLPSEDLKGQDRVAILSHGMWQRSFGGDRGVIGRRVVLDDGAYEVVGVLPAEFEFPTLEEIDLITPLGKDEAAELTRAEGSVTIIRNVVARMKPGVTVEQARAEMEFIESTLAPPPFFKGVQMSVKVIPLHERFAGNMRPALLTLLCAGGCVLLLVCANVANLLLGRGEERRRELAIRAAIGASRGRLIQQMLVESSVLAGTGCAAGLAVAYCSRTMLASLIPRTLPGPIELPVDRAVLAFAIGCALVTVIGFGLGPALANTAGRAMRRQNWLNGLAAAQMAVAIVLLAGGGLLLQSFWKQRYQNLGFATDRTVTATVSIAKPRPAQAAIIDAALESLRRVPGVERVAFGPLPPGDGHATNGFAIEGRAELPQGQRPVAREYSVSAGYFPLMGIPVLRGRAIDDSDNEVAVVNETFARSLFGGAEPLGARVRSAPDQPWRTIVGVVGDAPTAGLAKPAESAFFVPVREAGLIGGEGVGFLIRSPLGVATLVPAIRGAVAEADARTPVTRIAMLEERLDESTAKPRLAAVLLGLFALVGLLLAAAGIHSVMFVMARARVKEIGIRLALGGRPRDMTWMILRSSLRVMAAGIALGIVLALAAGRFVGSYLQGVSMIDLIALPVSAAVLLCAGLAAAAWPARQAARVDPIGGLRNE